MDRVIKFRAKQKYGTEIGKWWYGYFAKDHTGTSYITTLDGVDTAIVDEQTLGQFTGLVDKNGVEIYEGDRISHDKNIFIVKYSENLHRLLLRAENDKGMNWRDLEWVERVSKYLSTIGNIHEESEVHNG